MKLKLATILFISSFVSLQAQTKVTPFHPGQRADGVTYCLPRTQVKAELQAIKTVYTPGEFAVYAERYMHVQNVNPSATTRYEIVKIKLSTVGVPDTTKVFTVKLKDKSIAPMMQLTESGIVQSINRISGSPTENHQEDVLPSTRHQLNSRQYFTEEMLSSTSSARMAELVAQEIYDIRESKNEIMRGQVDAMPKDGASLKIVLDRLNQQEQALTQTFVGYTDTTYLSQSYIFEPTKDTDKEILFRFSKKLGFVDADDLAGTPYYISVTDLRQTPEDTRTEKEKIVQKDDPGLFINVPGKAHVVLYNANKTVKEMDVFYPQFGRVEALSASLFNKKVSTSFQLNQVTGTTMHLNVQEVGK